MRKLKAVLSVFCIFTVLFYLPGCQKTSASEPSAETAKTADASGAKASSGASKRDSTPKVLVPEASGTSVIGNDLIALDVSNTSEGYVLARYSGAAAKIKIFVFTPDQVKYTYDLTASDDWAALPLTGGNGTYQIEVYEQIEGTSYSTLFKEPSVPVTITDEFRPFLYPNQYTWFTSDSQTVKKAEALAENASDDLDVVTAVYDFTISTITYDEDKAKEAEEGKLSGYLPDVDRTLESKTGICFDYAALMTAMLRSQGIPTKLEIGYSGEAYHAWISTWLEEAGWVNNVIEFDGKTWTLMDPTLAANNSEKAVRKYVGDGSNYTVKYSR